MPDETKNITPVDGHVKMSERKCAVCGEIFSPSTMDRFLCDRCLYEKNHRSLTRMVVCKQCGKSFRGGLRAWYCPDCRYERAKEAVKRARQRKKNGESRHIGDTDICVDCGGEYIIESGRILPLRRLRLAAGLTQKQLAERIYATCPTIVNYERGIRPIPDDVAERIAAVLHCTPTEIKEGP